MADWITLSNEAVGVGGLPSGTTVTALRDNPIAIAEGATGAPGVRLKATNDVVAGDYFRLVSLTPVTTPSTSFQIAKLISNFYQAGTVRLQFEQSIAPDAGSLSAVARVVIDGVEVASWSTQSTTPVLRQVDVTVSFRSRIEIQHRMTGENSNSSVRNARLGDNNNNSSFIWPLNYSGWVSP